MRTDTVGQNRLSRILATGVVAVNILLIASNVAISLGLWDAPAMGKGPGRLELTARGIAAFAVRFSAIQVNLAEELNFATWYASALLLLTSLAALANAMEKRTGRFWWFAAAAICLGLSVDEVAFIHERILFATYSGDTVRLGLRFTEPNYWLLPYAPLIILSLLLLIGFVRRALSDTRGAALRGLIGIMFWVMSIIVEFVQPGIEGPQERMTLLGVLQEGGEIVGTTFLLAASTLCLKRKPAST